MINVRYNIPVQKKKIEIGNAHLMKIQNIYVVCIYTIFILF